MGTLFVVATPIGNLEDITFRALRVLKEVALIAAEDTRTTRKLLNHYGINTPLTSYHDHNMRAKTPRLLQNLEEKDVALVSEAGMPGLSDPGYELIRAAIEDGIPIVPIPGASAVTTALVVSGLPTDQFVYLGFLPRRKGERRRLLQSLTRDHRTLMAFEAPHRLRKTLQDIEDTLGDRPITVCRELTKVYEEVFRGRVSEAIQHFAEPRGEFTLVIQGAGLEEQDTVTEERDIEVKRALQELISKGIRTKEAVAQVASERRMPKRKVYRMWLELKDLKE